VEVGRGKGVCHAMLYNRYDVVYRNLFTFVMG